MGEATPRVRRLREHALRQTQQWQAPQEQELWARRSWIESAGEPWTVVRHARKTAAILRGLTPVIDADELLVGKPCNRPLTEAEAEELATYRRWSAPAEPPVLGQRAHMAIDFDKLLKLGVAGLRRQSGPFSGRPALARQSDGAGSATATLRR